MTSLEQWRQACQDSQAHADRRRLEASDRRVSADHERRVALCIAVWLAVGLLTWWTLTLL